jgi:anti-sigma regulatory factor (Ser/Thr protein kinase)
MPHSIRIPVDEASKTAEARRTAREMAIQIGFDEVQSERVAIVITEACTNLLKHAGRGEILLRATGEDPRTLSALEVMALDQGPGMNLDICFRDGYSTSNSYGQGLGAITRLSTASDFYSIPAKGTVVLARWDAPGGASPARERDQDLRVGAVNVCKPGQEVCGDSWGMEQSERHSVLLVADGLGHGFEAHTASSEAVRMLHLHPDLPPKALLERLHQALRSTRGAAVAIAQIDRARRKLTFAGAGNISAQIYSGTSQTSQHLVSVNGTAGHQTQTLREFSYAWPDDGLLVLHSDGLATGTSLDGYPRLRSRDSTLIAGVLYRDFSRGHDDSTVVIAKAA